MAKSLFKFSSIAPILRQSTSNPFCRGKHCKTPEEKIKESGARFLRQDDSGFWMEVSNDVARQKVSIGFRDVRKAKQKLIASAVVAPKPVSSSKRKVDTYDGNSASEETSPFGFLEGGKRHRSECAGCFDTK